MSNLEKWIEQCETAASEELSFEDKNKLSRQIYGAFCKKPGHVAIAYNAEHKDWDATLGGLLAYQDELEHELAKAEASSSNVNTSASADSSAHSSAEVIVSMSFGEAIEAVDALDLEDDNKDALIDLLRVVRRSEKDESLAKHALKSLIDKAFELGIDAVKAVIPYVWGVITTLGSC